MIPLPRIRPRRSHAFTLLEIMLVVAIIALLLTAGFMYLGKDLDFAKDTKVQADLTTLEGQLKLYEAMNGALPTTEQGLQALVTMPTAEPRPTKWYNLMSKLPKDAQQRDYVYECPGKHNPESYDLYSVGKDGIAGTDDDVGNWDEKK